MSSAKDRQRAAKRAKLEREMAARQALAARRKQRRIWSGSVALAVVAVALLVWAVWPSGGAKPIASAAKTTSCVYTPYPSSSQAPVPGANGSPAAQPTVNASDIVQTGLPPMENIPASGTRTMTINTNVGTLDISLDLTDAPCAANSMAYLASQNFYNNTKCSGFVTGGDVSEGTSGPYLLLCGSPNNTVDGGPSYNFPTENLPSDKQPDYSAGDVALYNSGDAVDGTPGYNGSTFLIFYQDTPGEIDPTSGIYQAALPANFTIIGHVTSGLDLVSSAASGAGSPDETGLSQPKTPITVQTVTMGPLPSGVATPTVAPTPSASSASKPSASSSSSKGSTGTTASAKP